MRKSISIAELHQLFLKSAGTCTDTRNIVPNTIFFALKGESFNGNAYVGKALEGGCAYAVVDEVYDPELGQESVFLVDDVLTCMQQLATYHRLQLKIPVIALSGSNGKTTSKELIHAVLEKKYKTHATKGNLNNHIGVPLTLLSTPVDAEVLVVEMGANHQQEITALCEIAVPNYGLLTNIGKAHLEGFGGIEGVKKGKTELYSYLNANKGKVFFNNNESSIAEFKQMPTAKIEYGTGTEIQVTKFSQGKDFLNIEIDNKGELLQFTTHLFGEYNVNNVLTAVAIGLQFGVQVASIKKAINSYLPSNNRSQVKQTEKGNELVLDAYNANPTSMQNAVQQFSKINPLRGVYLLGDMLELGEESEKEHQAVLNMLLGFKGEMLLVGPRFYAFKNRFPFSFYSSIDELLAEKKLLGFTHENILIKGSRGVALEKSLHQL